MTYAAQQYSCGVGSALRGALLSVQYAAVLLDLQGPKIRLGQFEKENCELTTDAEFTITVERVLGNAQRASTGFAAFAREVRPGARVLLADGAVVLEALASDGVASALYGTPAS